jgi:hypothetical protein
MKSFCSLFAALLVVVAASHLQVSAQSFRIGGGVGSAFEQVVAVRFPLPNGASYLYPVSQAQSTSYHAALRYMLSVDRGVGFTISGAVHHAETPVFTLLDPSQEPLSVKVSQTLVPLGVGFEYRFFPLLIFHAYVSGEATYNILFNATESSLLGTQTLAAQRIGANVALGADLLIFGVGADVAIRYSWANIVWRERSELSRTFLALTISLVLGEK